MCRTARPDFALVFPPAPGWVRTAREAVRTALTAAHREELTDTALLLTSEAVTNAINACRGSGCSAPVTLHAEWAAGGALRVLVRDDAPGMPRLGRPYPERQESGRGLLLISACATDWGVCRHGPGPGKAVWFRIAR
ncbi:ATP-binding protein [Streptomyces orinoci]|uniref:ATP-binding protein n=1 Tax=Streptomyces orinoci TaxID=67339 RepID=A0ABV3JTI1_STRON|nr:ATP-binding protein [Streptomyces orinoci]